MPVLVAKLTFRCATVPVEVIDTFIQEDGSEEKIMTYTFDNIVLGEPVRGFTICTVA